MLGSAIESIASGRYAIGVSGGADSIALLRLAHARRDLELHVVHLDHETRGGESTADGEFVVALARRLGLGVTRRLRSELEPEVAGLPVNRSARFRRLRLELYRRVVVEHGLSGVLLAHHADDQAETVMQRLLRGSGPLGLGGMYPMACVAGVVVYRPLLEVRREALREYLRGIGQPWREDASNQSDRYGRNRVRRLLGQMPELVELLLDLSARAQAFKAWVQSAAPKLEESFVVTAVQDYPPVLQDRALRWWLVERGCPPQRVAAEVVDRLGRMVNDAASAAQVQFPGNITVRRRGGVIWKQR